MELRTPYPTDLSDREWALIQHVVPVAKPGGRPENYPTRDILDAIVYLLRGSCAWRLLPPDLPPWQLGYQDFWRWRQDGPGPCLHDRLRGDVRVAAGKQRQPSAGLIESPSVKTTAKGGRGDDAGQQVKGCPRHIRVDTLGLRLTGVVTAARVPDRAGAQPLLDLLRPRCSRLRQRWADGASAGPLVSWVRALRTSAADPSGEHHAFGQRHGRHRDPNTVERRAHPGVAASLPPVVQR